MMLGSLQKLFYIFYPSLKSLTLFIGESHRGGKDCTVIELFKCLPMIEHLTTFGYVVEWLVLDSVPQDLPTLLVHLKYFCFEQMCSVDGFGIAFLLVLIKCSPNLEKIKLEIDRHHTCNEEYAILWEDYSHVRLEHLNELEIEGFWNTKPEMVFVKFILARSPKLKKVSIFGSITRQDPEILKTLLQASRISGNSNCQMRVGSKIARSLTFL